MEVAYRYRYYTEGKNRLKRLFFIFALLPH
jgi:hypothetical protein